MTTLDDIGQEQPAGGPSHVELAVRWVFWEAPTSDMVPVRLASLRARGRGWEDDRARVLYSAASTQCERLVDMGYGWRDARDWQGMLTGTRGGRGGQ